MRLDLNRSISSAVVVAVPLLCSSLLYGENSVDFKLQEQWDGGYNADIVLQVDQAGSTLSDWELSWLGTPEVEVAWNCIALQEGDRTILQHVRYNATILPGESVVLGYSGIGSWPPSPTDVRINGELVVVRIDGGDGGDDGRGDPQECCFGDIDGNQVVDGGDLALVLAAWNTSGAQADLDQSSFVDGADLALVLSQWGVCDDHSHGDYIDITEWGDFHDSNDNSEHDQMVGGRRAITTEAMGAYNNLRAFLELSELSYEEVGQWAFDESLTNNSQAWEDDLNGVGLYYAMQGAKVGWITDEAYEPQILADIQRTARTVCNPFEMKAAVMAMVREYGLAGYADYLEENDMVDTFINTLKMEPHYGGWMHGRCHGYRSIEGVAINHDINHLTVLSWDQMQPFMNDTFDWPQWPALDVSDSGVIEYFQSMVVLGDPVGDNM